MFHRNKGLAYTVRPLLLLVMNESIRNSVFESSKYHPAYHSIFLIRIRGLDLPFIKPSHMKIMSLLSMLISLTLVAGSVYMFFEHHFSLYTTLAIVSSGCFLFVFALIVMMRLSIPIDAKSNTYSPMSSFSPPSN